MFDIKITQFVNPHLFYYQPEEYELLPKPYEKEFKEQLPGREYICRKTTIYEPKRLEIVAHYNIIEDKWIRAQVDYVTYSLLGDEKIYFLFALDYGYSIESTGKWLWPLPSCYKEPSHCIFKGGINSIIPCGLKLNSVTAKTEYKITKEWSSSSVLRLSRLIDSCQAIKFSPELRLVNGHIFGSLSCKTVTLDVVDAGKDLIKGKHAFLSEDFIGDLGKIHTTNIKRWHKNDHNVVDFGLKTVSENLVSRMVHRDSREEEIDLGSAVMDSGITAMTPITPSEIDRKREIRHFKCHNEEKVINWWEKNEKFLIVDPEENAEAQLKKTEEINKLCQEVPVVEMPKSVAEVIPPKSTTTTVVNTEKDAIEEKKEPNFFMKDLLRALSEAPESEDFSNRSSRALVTPKPAGIILNPKTD